MRSHATLHALAICGLLSGCGLVHKPGNGGKGGGVRDAGSDMAEANDPNGTGGSGGPIPGPADLSGMNDDGCPNSSPTTVKGRVFAPNGKLPLYNATVYVPSSAPPEPKDGVTCDRCGNIGARALAVAQTDATGAFTLTNVPSGTNVQVVLEMGKWRRIVTVPLVKHCETTMVAEADSRLPRSHTEGNMPRMAIATGGADPFECLLLKIGIDKSEFTPSTGMGRVHFYQATTSPGTNLTPAAPKADDATNGLFVNAAKLLQYDVLLLPCEGEEKYANTTDAQRAMLVPYLDAGGRLFTTHYSYNWLTYDKSPYNVIGKWAPGGDATTMSGNGTLDTSFPKGMAFSQWLHNVDNKVNGSFDIQDPRFNLETVDPKYAQRWIYYTSDQKVMHTTFNTPLNPPLDKDGKPQYCGRALFSAFHVSATALTPTIPPPKDGQSFPSACKDEDMTTQEKALAFMLFDLSSCVIPDTQPPIP